MLALPDFVKREIERRYRAEGYDEVVNAGLFRDPLNYYLVCVYPIRPIDGLEVDAEEIFKNFNGEVALYFHIPFCMTRCSFCNFLLQVNAKAPNVNSYLDALAREAGLVAEALENGGASPKIHSIYIGGGTPTYLTPDQMERLFTKAIEEPFRKYFPPDHLEEITVECSPGTLTDAHLDVMQAHHVDRVSVGVQTFDDDALRLLGRTPDHDVAKALKAIDLLHRRMDGRFNVDLIPGLPIGRSEGREQFFTRLYRDLQHIINLNVPSVTFYHLWTRWMQNTSLVKNVQAGEWVLPSREEVVKLWLMINYVLVESAGYTQNPAGWFLREQASTFRQQIFKWSAGHQYLGLGVSAYSYFNGYVFWSVGGQGSDPARKAIKAITDYENMVANGRLPYVRVSRMTDEERERLNAVFGIKTDSGVDFSNVQHANVRETITLLEGLELLARDKHDEDRFRLTKKGFVFFDEVCETFFSQPEQELIRKDLNIDEIYRRRIIHNLRRGLQEVREKLADTPSRGFDEAWEGALHELILPRLGPALSSFLGLALRSSGLRRFLLAWLFLDEKGHGRLLKPYYHDPSAWYADVISGWFEGKTKKGDAVSLTEILFQPNGSAGHTSEYFPPPVLFSLSLEEAVPAGVYQLHVSDLRKAILDATRKLTGTQKSGVAEAFQELYGGKRLDDTFLDALLNVLRNDQSAKSTIEAFTSRLLVTLGSVYPERHHASGAAERVKQDASLLWPSLIAFFGNDDREAQHYLFTSLDVDERCIPLAVVLELKSPPRTEALRRVMAMLRATLPMLFRAHERILVERLRDEARYHALRSALASVLARNMAHNVGSHPLARLLARLEEAEKDSVEQPSSNQITKLLNYVKGRIDFIAEVTTYWEEIS